MPNFITCLNLITGALGCMAVIEGQLNLAIYYVVLAGLFDFMDGFAARLLKVHSAIGKELDSLADVISFGLLPAFFMYQLIGSSASWSYLSFAGLAIAAFSALRLAKFNVDESQSDKFVGLPTPANAIMITSLIFLPEQVELTTSALLVVTVISCYLMISNMILIALKFAGFGWRGNELRYVIVGGIVLLVAIFQLSAIPFIIPYYILVSVYGNFKVKRAI